MKNVIYFLGLILIAFCSCSTTKEYTDILHQFVELNAAIGVPKEDVGVLISSVKNTITKAEAAQSEFHSSVEKHCSSALATVESQLKGIADSINDAKNQVNTWTKNAEASAKEVTAAEESLAKSVAALQETTKRINQILLDYKVFAEEADRKLAVVKVLNDIIMDELYNTKAPGAFIQVTKFQDKLAELKGMLSKNSDSFYTPIISVLIDLATEQNFANQDILKKILENLNNLKKSLEDFRAKQEESLNADMEAQKNLAKINKDNIKSYRRMRNQAVSKGVDAQHYRTFYSNEIEHFEAENVRVGDEQRLFKKLCDFQQTVHNDAAAAADQFKKETYPYLLANIADLNK